MFQLRIVDSEANATAYKKTIKSSNIGKLVKVHCWVASIPSTVNRMIFSVHYCIVCSYETYMEVSNQEDTFVPARMCLMCEKNGLRNTDINLIESTRSSIFHQVQTCKVRSADLACTSHDWAKCDVFLDRGPYGNYNHHDTRTSTVEAYVKTPAPCKFTTKDTSHDIELGQIITVTGMY